MNHRPPSITDAVMIGGQTRPTSPKVKEANEALHVATFKTADAVEDLRGLWRVWQMHPNTDLDRFLAVISAREEALRPHVLVAYSGEQPVAILVGRLENGPFNLQVGYKSVFRPKVRALRILHGGWLGERSDAVHNALLSELLSSLSSGEVEVVVLNFLRVGSGLYQVVKDLVKPWHRDHFTMPNIHWSIELPRTYDEYLRSLSKNTRKSIRRHASLLNQDFGDSLVLRRLASVGELDEMLQDMEAVACKTYQRKLGVGFQKDKETRRSMELALREGRLSALVLYLKGQPVAFDSGNLCGDTVFLGECGYDPAYASYGLGTFLLCRQIEAACGHPEIRRVDFGFGPASYKEALANAHWHEKPICIFAPTPRGVVLNLLRTFFNGLHHLLHRTLKGVGIYERVRRVFKNQKFVGAVKSAACKSVLSLEHFFVGHYF